ncbi:MAG: hypothetical protein SFV51_28300 [Bryobacteraceae bacterium]|nr:hypothetical protein [Bryobacteraceae bacterium]
MTPTISLFFLLSGSGLELPSLGTVRSEAGWRELFGFRGNFLWAEVPAANQAPFSAWNANRQERFLWDGSALTIRRQGSERTAALVGVRGEPAGIGYRDGRLLVLTREAQGTLWTFDAATLEPSGSEPAWIGSGPAAIDSHGTIWTAEHTQVRCQGERWDAGSRIAALEAMDDGWMIVRTPRVWFIARAGDPVLYLLPNP